MRNKDSVKQISIEYNDSNTSFTFQKKGRKTTAKTTEKTRSASSFYSQCRIGYSQILQILF